MPTTMDVLLRIEHRLTVAECRLTALERREPKFEAGEFFRGLRGKGLILALLLAAQVPMKDALLAVFG